MGNAIIQVKSIPGRRRRSVLKGIDSLLFLAAALSFVAVAVTTLQRAGQQPGDLYFDQ